MLDSNEYTINDKIECRLDPRTGQYIFLDNTNNLIITKENNLSKWNNLIKSTFVFKYIKINELPESKLLDNFNKIFSIMNKNLKYIKENVYEIKDKINKDIEIENIEYLKIKDPKNSFFNDLCLEVYKILLFEDKKENESSLYEVNDILENLFGRDNLENKSKPIKKKKK